MERYIQALPDSHWLARFQKNIHHGDRPWQVLIIIASALVTILIIAIGVMLWRDSAQARATFGFGFLAPSADPHWDPVNDQFQAWPFIYGTLLTSFVALLF